MATPSPPTQSIAAQERQRYLASAFEFVTTGLAIVSLEGRVLQANPRMCEMFGHAQDALLDMTWQEVTPADELQVDLGHVSRLLAGERDSYERDKRFLRADASEFRAHFGSALVRDEAMNTPQHGGPARNSGVG